MATAYIALGANLGDRLATMREAVAALGRLGEVTAASSVYETAPVGFVDQPPYLNAVVALETALSPRQLLDRLLTIEQRFGRVRTFVNAPRTLDLDLLLYDNLIVDEAGLRVPHPRMHERAFVLVPLREIAPELTVPTTGRRVADWLRDIEPVTGMERFADPPSAHG